MFSGFFCGCKQDSTISSTLNLKQTLESLEEKEVVLQKKISIEIDRAKTYMKAKNKQDALKCMKRKKFYERQMEQLRVLRSLIGSMEQRLSQKVPVHCRQEKTSKSKNNLENA